MKTNRRNRSNFTCLCDNTWEGIGFFFFWSFFQFDSRRLSFLSTKLLLDNLHHVIQYFYLQLVSLINLLLTQIGRLLFYKYANLFLTSIRPPNRGDLFFNSFDATNASSEVRPINGIIDYWYSTYQFLSNFMLKVLFFTTYLISSIYF